MEVNIANKDSLNMLCDFADFKIYLIKNVVYVYMYTWLQVPVESRSCQIPCSWNNKVVVSWLAWVLGSELRSSGRSNKCS